MKSKRLALDFFIPKAFLLILLAIASLFYLIGCSTKALQPSEEQKLPAKGEYWNINRVVSAVKQKNGAIYVCADLYKPGETGEAGERLLKLPLSILEGDTKAIAKFGFRSGDCLFPDATCYWHPSKKAFTSCKLHNFKNLALSEMQVERISVNRKDRYQLYTLLDNFSKSEPGIEKIYEISFSFGEEDTTKETGMVSVENVDYSAIGSKDRLLVYRPARIGQQGIQPIVIAGAYGDLFVSFSTNPILELTGNVFTGAEVAIILGVYVLLASGAWILLF